MNVNARRYEIHPDKVDELTTKVKEGLVPYLNQSPDLSTMIFLLPVQG